MVRPFTELAALTRNELIERYDQTSAHVTLGPECYREENFRRDMDEQNTRLVSLTKHIRLLTVVIMILTATNVVLVWLAT